MSTKDYVLEIGKNTTVFLLGYNSNKSHIYFNGDYILFRESHFQLKSIKEELIF